VGAQRRFFAHASYAFARVERRIGIGHACHGGKAAAHCRQRSGFKRLLLREAGIAEMDVHVDETRCDDRVVRIHDGLARERLEAFAEFYDKAGGDSEVATGIEFLTGIDDAPTPDQQVRASQLRRARARR
jgi:hypothetical protein